MRQLLTSSIEDSDAQQSLVDSVNVVEEPSSSHQTSISNEIRGNTYSSQVLPELKSTIRCRKIGENSWRTMEVISRAGKVTGKNKFCRNVKDLLTNEEFCYDWVNDVQEWYPIEFEEVLLANSGHDDVKIQQAKLTELNRWKEFEVYKEVEDNGQKCISTRWVCTEKETVEGITDKARLVARGFEDNEITRKDSPTCAKAHLRTIIAIAASNGWKLKSLDVKAAFLQGSKMTRDVYIKPPPEAQTDKLWKLQKCVYGLGDASRLWYLKLKEELNNSGVDKSIFDGAVYYKHEMEQLLGLLASHVDDVLWASTTSFEKNVIDKLKSTFQISKETCEDAFKYVGLSLEHEDGIISINQDHYINDIKPIEINKSPKRDPHDLVSAEESKQLRSTIGQLNWVATQSRPDIAFDVCQASVSFKDATLKDLKRVNKVIRQLHNCKVRIKCRNLGDLSQCSLVAYSDASYMNLSDGGSQGGHIIFLRNRLGHVIPLQWQSKRVRRIARSTMAAECLAMLDAVDSAFLLKSLLEEILPGEKCIEIVSVVDNKNIFDSIQSTSSVEDKRLSVDIGYLREKINNKEIAGIRLVSTTKQIANCLTKSGASTELLLDVLDNGIIDESLMSV